MDIRTLVLMNFILQIALVGALFFAAYLARNRKLARHCMVMRIMVPVQIAAAAVVMVPSFLSYTTGGVPVTWLYIEMVFHGALGLGIVVIWIFVNLAQAGIMRVRRRLQFPMRLAFSLWLVNFALGSHMYFILWT
ncbi:MAG: hypothetical protein Q8Q07_06125 [Dehalococcoidales bacterium]|nr:hypothetical protein [Dehalococcoidales bacterium]